MPSVEGAVTITQRDSTGATTTILNLNGSQVDESAIYFITKFFDLGPWTAPDSPRDSTYRIQGIVLEMQETDPTFVNVKIGAKENINDPEVWYGPYDITPGELFQLNITGRFFAIKLTEVIATTAWQLSAIKLFGMPTGVSRRYV